MAFATYVLLLSLKWAEACDIDSPSDVLEKWTMDQHFSTIMLCP